MIVDAAEGLLDPVADIGGFVLACLVDGTTGMTLASRSAAGGLSVAAAAAGASDFATVLALLTSELPAQDAEEVTVTFPDRLFLVRLVRQDPGPPLLLALLLDRERANLGLARYELRQYCAGLAA